MLNLSERFINNISEQRLFSVKDPLLLAVSGGVDSVVLTDLCARAGFSVRIAHMNFQLRGPESDRDEAFVKSLAAKYGIEVLIKKTDADKFAKEQKVSVQLAARNLRYDWFASLLTEFPSIRHVLTAHQLDDDIETLLMHFFRGTGIQGLRGIPMKRNHIVRPLLFARKDELVLYAKENKLEWVEDSSNDTDHYTRNYFRNQLLPSIRDVFPEVQANLAGNIERLSQAALLYDQAIDWHRANLLVQKGNEVHIPVLKLRKSNPGKTILLEILSPYGFNAAQTVEAYQLMDSANGKQVLSPTHRIFRNRSWLVIAPVADPNAVSILVEETDSLVSYAGGQLQFLKKKKSISAESTITNPPGEAQLDTSSIRFPLLLRKWKNGDYFYPLGMRKKKKIARFLIDQKLSRSAKEQVWVLEMDKTILWVVGHRIDDRYKVTTGTASILRITSVGAGVR